MVLNAESCYAECHYAGCLVCCIVMLYVALVFCYAECRVCCIVMLNVFMPRVAFVFVMLSVSTQNVNMLSVIFALMVCQMLFC